MRSARKLASILVLLGCVAGTGIAPASARSRPVCPGGVFRASPLPLIDGAPAAEDGIIVLHDAKVSIGRNCAPTPARVRARRNGTRVSARWRACDGVTGPVRLVATIDSTCNTIVSGTLRADGDVKSFQAEDFASHPSSMTAPPTPVVRSLLIHPLRQALSVVIPHVSGTLTCAVRDGSDSISVPLPQLPIEIAGLGTTVTNDDGSFFLPIGSPAPQTVHIKATYDAAMWGGKSSDSQPDVGTRLQVGTDIGVRSDEMDASGTITGACQSGQELSGGLCYPQCAAGYEGAGSTCWEICRTGYFPQGISCTNQSRTSCLGVTACPPLSVYLRANYSRGAGTAPVYSTLDLGTIRFGSLDCDLWRSGAYALKDYHDVMQESPPAGELRIVRLDSPLVKPFTFYDHVVIGNNIVDQFPDAVGRETTVLHEFAHSVRHVASAGGTRANWDSDDLHYAYGADADIGNKAFAFNEGWAIFWEATRGRGDSIILPGHDDSYRDWDKLLVAERLQGIAAQVGHATMVRVLKDNPGTVLGLHDFEVRLAQRLGQPGPPAPPDCPPDFADLPGTCYSVGLSQSIVKLSYGRGVGVPIDSCPDGLEYDWGLCYPPCADGYTGHGPVCWNFPDSYGRGVGTPLTCAPGLQYDWGLCYTPCAPDYYGVGPVCWE